MTNAICTDLRRALADALAGALEIPFDAEAVRMPARRAAASIRPPEGTDISRIRADAFPFLFGAPPVSAVRTANGWLLLDFSDSFYDAFVRRACETLPAVRFEGSDHAVNRMLVLSRHGGAGCPRVPSVQRALLLAVCAGESAAAYRKAAHALETMLLSVPPRERPALILVCGAFGNAAARLLSAAKKE